MTTIETQETQEMQPSQHDKVQYAAYCWLEAKGYKCETEANFETELRSYRIDI